MNCRICNLDSINNVEGLEKYIKCKNCGSYFLKKEYFLSEEQQIERYKLHNNDVNNPQYEQYFYKIFIQVKEQINKNLDFLGLKSFFDYGSGPEPCFISLLNKLKERKEINENSIINGWDPLFNNTISDLKYDIVFCIEVIEHFERPQENLKNLVSYCNDKGFLVIKTGFLPEPSINTKECDIFFSKWWYRQDSTHVSFFTKKALIDFLHIYDFIVFYENKDLLIFRKQ